MRELYDRSIQRAKQTRWKAASVDQLHRFLSLKRSCTSTEFAADTCLGRAATPRLRCRPRSRYCPLFLSTIPWNFFRKIRSGAKRFFYERREKFSTAFRSACSAVKKNGCVQDLNLGPNARGRDPPNSWHNWHFEAQPTASARLTQARQCNGPPSVASLAKAWIEVPMAYLSGRQSNRRRILGIVTHGLRSRPDRRNAADRNHPI